MLLPALQALHKRSTSQQVFGSLPARTAETGYTANSSSSLFHDILENTKKERHLRVSWKRSNKPIRKHSKLHQGRLQNKIVKFNLTLGRARDCRGGPVGPFTAAAAPSPSSFSAAATARAMASVTPSPPGPRADCEPLPLPPRGVSDAPDGDAGVDRDFLLPWRGLEARLPSRCALCGVGGWGGGLGS